MVLPDSGDGGDSTHPMTCIQMEVFVTGSAAKARFSWEVCRRWDVGLGVSSVGVCRIRGVSTACRWPRIFFGERTAASMPVAFTAFSFHHIASSSTLSPT